ncbi:hypothetical protein [Rhodococcus sp. BS-15]|uniref:hypothetical protein n=1 Tax=Rhodococcus sp. BS-15 TaxID=1304954 RepID=UPI000A458FCF|nr:hypothetical protein [Rhodococcus sp. BS-15]
MSFARTKRIAATTTAVSLAAAGVLLANAPAAAAVPVTIEGPVPAYYARRWCRFPSLTP